MEFVYDAMVVVVFIGCVNKCYKKGFLKSVFSLCSVVLSFVIMKFLRRGIFKFFLKNVIYLEIEKNLIELLKPILVNFATKGKFNSIAESFNGEQNLIVNSADEFVNSFIMKNFVRPCLFYLIYSILIYLIFSLIRVVFKKIFKLTNSFRKMAPIKAIDGLLGGICGIVEAGIVLLLIAFAFVVLINLTQNKLNWLNEKILKKTSLFYLFYRFIPTKFSYNF